MSCRAGVCVLESWYIILDDFYVAFVPGVCPDEVVLCPGRLVSVLGICCVCPDEVLVCVLGVCVCVCWSAGGEPEPVSDPARWPRGRHVSTLFFLRLRSVIPGITFLSLFSFIVSFHLSTRLSPSSLSHLPSHCPTVAFFVFSVSRRPIVVEP